MVVTFVTAVMPSSRVSPGRSRSWSTPWLTACLIAAISSAAWCGVPSARAAEEKDGGAAAATAEPAAADAPAGNAPATHAEAETVDQMKLLVRPLTAEDLAEAAVAWRERLKEKVGQIARLQLDTKQARNDAEQTPDADATQKLTKLQQERTILTDLLRVVVDEWERKGGDPAEFRLYSTAVSGLEVDVEDAGAAFTTVKNWAISEQGGIRWAWNILKFVAILMSFWILSRMLATITGHAVARIKGASSLLRSFLVNFVRQATLIVGMVMALSALEINTNPLLALIGGAAFVIGLALQGTLANFAHGLLILAYRPFDVGDVVEAGGVSGIVDSMNMLSTTIRTFDNKLMIVPNGQIGGGTITNSTASDTRRVDLVFGVGYGDDLDKVQGILERVVKAHPQVLAEPAPLIKVNTLADSAVNFVVRPWTKTGDYWTVYWDLTREVKKAFDAAGISIPFPQRDIHVHHIDRPA
jgi:small conductance mechanosensitive channel